MSKDPALIPALFLDRDGVIIENRPDYHVFELIENAGGRIDCVFMCPHTPAEACPCRKPLPGLLMQAAEVLNIDLTRSTLIGDAISDLQAGRSAGLSKLALVRTGRGGEQEALLTDTLGHTTVFDDLKSALSVWFKTQ